jgi:hypothetical protein
MAFEIEASLMWTRRIHREIFFSRFLPSKVKSYATGRAVFEAQNQAAVSGVCAVKLFRQLDDLYAEHFSLSEKLLRLAFSICSEGAYLQLWVHYVKPWSVSTSLDA